MCGPRSRACTVEIAIESLGDPTRQARSERAVSLCAAGTCPASSLEPPEAYGLPPNDALQSTRLLLFARCARFIRSLATERWALDINTDCMTADELLREYDLYDAEIIRHGFRPTMRDYVLGVWRADGLAHPGMFEYVFRGCMEARYTVTLPPGAISLDDRLLSREASAVPDAPDGFMWCVRSACSAEEGVTLTANSDRARSWTERLGLPMQEIVIGTNVYQLALVFHELQVQQVQAGSEPGDV